MSNAQLSAVQNLVQVRDGGVNPNRGKARYVALKCALLSWDNYPDPEGKPTPFERVKGNQVVEGLTIDGPPTDETLERLEIEHWNDLGDQILAANVLSEEDTKK